MGVASPCNSMRVLADFLFFSSRLIGGGRGWSQNKNQNERSGEQRGSDMSGRCGGRGR